MILAGVATLDEGRLPPWQPPQARSHRRWLPHCRPPRGCAGSTRQDSVAPVRGNSAAAGSPIGCEVRYIRGALLAVRLYKEEPTAMARVLLLNGPNLNLLGTREPAVYGTDTLASIEARVAAVAREGGHELMAFQSNAEHELIERVHQARSRASRFVILNPGRVHAHQCCAARRAAGHGAAVHRSPPVQHAGTRGVPPAILFLRHRGRSHPRPGGLRLRGGAARRRAAPGARGTRDAPSEPKVPRGNSRTWTFARSRS